MTKVLNVLLTHQAPAPVARMVKWWTQFVAEDHLLLAYGGTRPDFAQIGLGQKLFIDDERLRTRDHQREMQSYTAIFQAIAAWLGERDFTHFYFAEYDHLPLVADLNARQLAALAHEGADVLGHQVLRVNETNQPHYIYHVSNPAFAPFWQRMTIRKNGNVILSMFGSGSFWSREAFLAVAALPEPFPMYLEIWLPTLAHHLGFRVRSFGDQDRFVRSLGDFEGQIEQARRAGAWTLHPVKNLWHRESEAGFRAGS